MHKKKYENSMDAALSYLTSRMRTRAETENKLKELGYDPDEIESTLERLEELRLLDDTAFASEFIRTRNAAGHYSRAALKYQLQKHRVGKGLIEETLQTIDPDREYESAKAVALREWRLKSSCPVQERKKKVFAKLCRAGFEMDSVLSICRELAEGEEEEIDL